jgi:predicted transcriptional regulator
MADRKPSYRSRTEIFASILQTARIEKTEVGLTRLMYNSLLSYNQANRYVGVLKENGLLNYDSNKKYTITSKGLRFLELYEKIDNLLRIT